MCVTCNIFSTLDTAQQTAAAAIYGVMGQSTAHIFKSAVGIWVAYVGIRMVLGLEKDLSTRLVQFLLFAIAWAMFSGQADYDAYVMEPFRLYILEVSGDVVRGSGGYGGASDASSTLKAVEGSFTCVMGVGWQMFKEVGLVPEVSRPAAALVLVTPYILGLVVFLLGYAEVIVVLFLLKAFGPLYVALCAWKPTRSITSNVIKLICQQGLGLLFSCGIIGLNMQLLQTMLTGVPGSCATGWSGTKDFAWSANFVALVIFGLFNIMMMFKAVGWAGQIVGFFASASAQAGGLAGMAMGARAGVAGAMKLIQEGLKGGKKLGELTGRYRGAAGGGSRGVPGVAGMPGSGGPPGGGGAAGPGGAAGVGGGSGGRTPTDTAGAPGRASSSGRDAKDGKTGGGDGSGEGTRSASGGGQTYETPDERERRQAAKESPEQWLERRMQEGGSSRAVRSGSARVGANVGSAGSDAHEAVLERLRARAQGAKGTAGGADGGADGSARLAGAARTSGAVGGNAERASSDGEHGERRAARDHSGGGRGERRAAAVTSGSGRGGAGVGPGAGVAAERERSAMGSRTRPGASGPPESGEAPAEEKARGRSAAVRSAAAVRSSDGPEPAPKSGGRRTALTERKKAR